MEELEKEYEFIELVDEDGKVINFKLLGVTEYKGEKYTLLLPAETNDTVAEDEVVVFRLNEEEETLETIEDENLMQEVFDFYLAETEAEIVDEEESDSEN